MTDLKINLSKVNINNPIYIENGKHPLIFNYVKTKEPSKKLELLKEIIESKKYSLYQQFYGWAFTFTLMDEILWLNPLTDVKRFKYLLSLYASDLEILDLQKDFYQSICGEPEYVEELLKYKLPKEMLYKLADQICYHHDVDTLKKILEKGVIPECITESDIYRTKKSIYQCAIRFNTVDINPTFISKKILKYLLDSGVFPPDGKFLESVKKFREIINENDEESNCGDNDNNINNTNGIRLADLLDRVINSKHFFTFDQ